MHRRAAFLAGALACAILPACEDVNGLPKWDADWYVPLPSQSIQLPAAFGGTNVPGNANVPISFPTQTQSLAEAVGQVLSQQLRAAKVFVTLDKTVPLATDDTLFVGESNAALVPGNPRTIVLRVAMTAAQTSVTDSVIITAARLQMLTDVANANGQLFIKLSGRASNPSASPVTLTATERIGVRVAIVATIAVSR